MKKLSIVILFSSIGIIFSNDIELITDDGKTVILYENGTWEYKIKNQETNLKVYKIGNINIGIFPSYVNISNKNTYSKRFEYHTERGDEDFIISNNLIYFYHLNDWQQPIDCSDFKPTKNNPHIVDMSTANFENHHMTEKIKELNEKDFVKFPFFSDRHKSIGFYFGALGASSGYGTMMIFNTENDEFVEFPIRMCNHPEFDINSNTFPPAYFEREIAGFSFSWPPRYVGGSFPYAPALLINKFYTYDNGKYLFDEKKSKKYYLKMFKESKLNKDEINYLKNISLFDVPPQSESVIKLVQYLFYAKKLNYLDESKEVLSSIHISFKDEGLEYRYELNPY